MFTCTNYILAFGQQLKDKKFCKIKRKGNGEELAQNAIKISVNWIKKKYYLKKRLLLLACENFNNNNNGETRLSCFNVKTNCFIKIKNILVRLYYLNYLLFG